MTVIGLVSTDIYVPLLPDIANTFAVPGSVLQLSLTSYFLGLSLAQLFYGPMSDAWGRKPVVLLGISIFTIASILIVFVPNVECLLVARFFQAIGACAGMTVGRSIVGEIYTKEETGKIFATIFPFIGLSPAIAPVIGGIIGNYFGWRAIFVFIFFLGLLLILLIKSKLPETKREDERVPLNMTGVTHNYLKILSSRIFWGYALCPCFAYIAYFAYLAESPFILSQYGYSAKMISFFYITLAISYVVGNFSARKLLYYLHISRVIVVGYIFFMAGGFLMLLLNYELNLNHLSLDLIFPITVLTFGNGFLLPLGNAGVITSFPKNSGYASGLLGFLQLVSAALTTAVIGIVSQGNPCILACYIFGTTVIGAILYFILIKPMVNTVKERRET